MIFGYARVSTKDQNLDSQLDALKKAGCEKIFMEKESGAKDDRPERQRMLDQLRAGDTVIVYKLDRFSRSMIDLIQKAEELRQRDIAFVSLTDGIATNTPTGKMQFNVFAAFAEFQRDIIRENTKAGLAAARARGRTGGRKQKLTPKQEKEIHTLYAKGDISVTQIATAYSVHRNTIYNIVGKKK